MFLTLMFVKTIFRHESNVTCFKDVFLSLPGHISSASAAGKRFIKKRGEKKSLKLRLKMVLQCSSEAYRKLSLS